MDIVKIVNDNIAQLLDAAIELLPGLIGALIVLMLTRYAAQVVRRIVERVAKRAVDSKSLQFLFVKTANVSTWVLGIFVAAICAFPDLSLSNLIATLGLGSVAVGFAFQDIFKNFLSGVLLLIQRPFRIDDQIIVGDYEGTVEQIELRTTRIRTYDGERVLMPNSEVYASAVRVRTAYDQRRTDLSVGVDYNTSLPEAKNLLLRTISSVEGVLENKAPEIDIVGFGDSSIDFIVRYWTHSRQPQVRQTQTKAIIAIKQALDEAGIGIPYPIRTLYFYDQEKYNDFMPSGKDKGQGDRSYNSIN